MKPVTVKMNAGDLKGIIDLPNYPDNQSIEITVSPSPDVEEKTLTKEEVINIVNELAGCLANSPYKNKSRDEIRYERIMSKYESLH